MKLKDIVADFVPGLGLFSSWKKVREMNADYFVNIEDSNESFSKRVFKNVSYGIFMTGVQVAEFYGLFSLARYFCEK